MRTALLLPFLLVSLPTTTGCAIEAVTTEIQLRDPSHAALVRTDARGSQRLPLPADGTIALDGVAAPSITLESPTTIARWCTMLGREPRGQKLKYSVVADPKCADAPLAGSVGYTLEGNWNDVRIVERHRPDHAGAWAIAGASTVVFGGLSALVFSLGHVRGGPAVRYALGGTTAGIGATYDLSVLPTILTPDSDVLIHDFGGAATMRETAPLVIE
jgi:hypothetical protein